MWGQQTDSKVSTMSIPQRNKLDSLLRAWTLSESSDLPVGAVPPSELAAAERELGLALPSELKALYSLMDGAYLVGGNLQINPLRGDVFSLIFRVNGIRWQTVAFRSKSRVATI